MRIIHTIVLLSLLAAPAAFADTIDVHSTGLAPIGSSDPNYMITAMPSGATGTIPAAATVSGPNGNWFQPTGATNWIDNTGVGANGPGDQPVGIYKYETTFTLGANEDLTTAVLNMIIAADDSMQVFLNGNLVGSGGTYPTVTGFTVNTGFQYGTNTLEFDVNNSGGGPTGLYADISGSVSPVSPVPEPTSMALLGTGILSVAGLARRKFLRA